MRESEIPDLDRFRPHGRILLISDLRERLQLNGGPCGTYQCVSVKIDGSADEDVEPARFRPPDATGPTVGANCRCIEDNIREEGSSRRGEDVGAIGRR